MSQDKNRIVATSSQNTMDSIFNWVMNCPNDTMVSKIITCDYGSDVNNESVSGNLVAGTFLLIGYKRGEYANVTAYSYWNNRSISVATIENGTWAKRFDRVITNTDLQAHWPKVLHFNIEANTYKTIKEQGTNRFSQLLFLQAANTNGYGLYLLSGYGNEGGTNRYYISEIASGSQFNIEVSETSFKVTNSNHSTATVALVSFMGDIPTIQ